jgi:hypothetical protein
VKKNEFCFFELFNLIKSSGQRLDERIRHTQGVGIDGGLNVLMKLEPARPYRFEFLAIVLVESRILRRFLREDIEVGSCGVAKLADVFEELLRRFEVSGRIVINAELADRVHKRKKRGGVSFQCFNA